MQILILQNFPFNQRLLKQKALWKKILTKYIWQNIQVFLLSLLLPLPPSHFLSFKGIVLFSILLLSHLGGHLCCFLQYTSGNLAADVLQSELRSRQATRKAKTSYCKSSKIWDRSWSQSWCLGAALWVQGQVFAGLLLYLGAGSSSPVVTRGSAHPPCHPPRVLFGARSSTYP